MFSLCFVCFIGIFWMWYLEKRKYWDSETSLSLAIPLCLLSHVLEIRIPNTQTTAATTVKSETPSLGDPELDSVLASQGNPWSICHQGRPILSDLSALERSTKQLLRVPANPCGHSICVQSPWSSADEIMRVIYLHSCWKNSILPINASELWNLRECLVSAK